MVREEQKLQKQNERISQMRKSSIATSSLKATHMHQNDFLDRADNLLYNSLDENNDADGSQRDIYPGESEQ